MYLPGGHKQEVSISAATLQTSRSIAPVTEPPPAQPMPTLALVSFSTNQVIQSCRQWPHSGITSVPISSMLSLVQATPSPLPAAHAATQNKYSPTSAPGSRMESMTSLEYGAVDLSARTLRESGVSNGSRLRQAEMTSLATSVPTRPPLSVIISDVTTRQRVRSTSSVTLRQNFEVPLSVQSGFL